MKISQEEIKKIALLSRLEIKEENMAHMEKQLNSVLEYIDVLKQVDIEGVKPTVHAVELYNVWREDVRKPSLSNEEALMNAPDKENGYFKVPKVMQG